MGNWWDTVPLSPDDPRYHENRMMELIKALKDRNEIEFGDWYLVRLPKVEGKIFLNRKNGPHNAISCFFKSRMVKYKGKERLFRRIGYGEAIC